METKVQNGVGRMDSTLQESLIPVSVSTFIPSTTLGMNLFKPTGDGGYQLYREASYPLYEDDLERLKNRGIQQLYISQADRAEYQAYLREIAFEDASQTGASAQVRAQALGSVVRDILAESFKSHDTDKTVDTALRLGEVTSMLICDAEFAAADLTRVLHHDYHTFTHSTNVAMYCGILAKRLGYTAQDIEQITTGGLLHDIGKLDIDERILIKPDKLTDLEFLEIKRHPTFGLAQLAEREDLNFAQLMVVYQHHEKYDGTGYPVGLVGEEIHPWARLCAVVDVFDALTSHRPYRKPMPKSLAVEIMERGKGTHFDAEMLECWTDITRSCWHD